ncbi:MAG: hypothetical protein K2Q97_18630 [Burkholderiaceae bacterium]|nr:hypothetical protein [Burkholderiaceae bacterium]
MPDVPSSLLHDTFIKTSAGQQEVRMRTLGLSALARRILILVDGQRTGRDLGVFAAGEDIVLLLQELLRMDCIAVVSVAVSILPVAPMEPLTDQPQDELASLPVAQTRTAKELEMARNFMTNTVNSIFGHHNRISLLESIYGCESAEELRKVFPAWKSALESSSSGKKRLPEMIEKLFAVL